MTSEPDKTRHENKVNVANCCGRKLVKTCHHAKEIYKPRPKSNRYAVGMCLILAFRYNQIKS
ncbi:hypothetical protein PROVRETT_09909 [Providencia rettgeri DSM 1131]|nr:hypothetical protein PROVRETT_09909 [Providencia rettgeri DSM 1131]